MAIDLENRTRISNKVTAASSNVPTSFSNADSASLVLTGIAYATHLAVINETTERLAVNYEHGSTTSSPTKINAYVPAGGTGCFSAISLDDLQVSSTVYIKSDGSVISSGTIELWVW